MTLPITYKTALKMLIDDHPDHFKQWVIDYLKDESDNQIDNYVKTRLVLFPLLIDVNLFKHLINDTTSLASICNQIEKQGYYHLFNEIITSTEANQIILKGLSGHIATDRVKNQCVDKNKLEILETFFPNHIYLKILLDAYGCKGSNKERTRAYCAFNQLEEILKNTQADNNIRQYFILLAYWHSFRANIVYEIKNIMQSYLSMIENGGKIYIVKDNFASLVLTKFNNIMYYLGCYKATDNIIVREIEPKIHNTDILKSIFFLHTSQFKRYNLSSQEIRENILRTLNRDGHLAAYNLIRQILSSYPYIAPSWQYDFFQITNTDKAIAHSLMNKKLAYQTEIEEINKVQKFCNQFGLEFLLTNICNPTIRTQARRQIRGLCDCISLPINLILDSGENIIISKGNTPYSFMCKSNVRKKIIICADTLAKYILNNTWHINNKTFKITSINPEITDELSSSLFNIIKIIDQNAIIATIDRYISKFNYQSSKDLIEGHILSLAEQLSLPRL